MARGTESKNILTKKILETFEGSFINDKEIRIPMIENGEPIQIKLTLTAAKVNVNAGNDTAIPSVKNTEDVPLQQITEAEKKEVLDIIEKFNL